MKISTKSPHFLLKALLVVLSLFPLWAATLQDNKFLNDDTLITLTYAKNLARGNGFVFNHPPPTLGTTTPLLTLFVAGCSLFLIQIEITTIAIFFTAFCWILIIWVIYLFRLNLALKDWQAVIIILVILASGWLTFLGMEAYLFSLLLVLSVCLFYSNQFFLTGMVTGLLFLTRGEGFLVLGMMVLLRLFAEWRAIGKRSFRSFRPIISLLVGFFSIFIPWFFYAQATFGSFLPNTLTAKMVQGQLPFGKSFLRRLFSEWIPAWGNPFEIKKFPLLNFWWLMVIIGTISSIMRKSRWLFFLVWILVYTLAYLLLGVSAYWWYQLPILFVLQIFAGLGLIKVIEGIAKFVKTPILKGLLSYSIIGIFLFLLSLPTLKAAIYSKGDPRGDSYLKLCDWVKGNTRPHESIAFIEIGYLGYFTNNTIIDLAGLMNPKIMPYIKKNDFSSGFWRSRPDYYIHLKDFDWVLGRIRINPRFNREYEPLATLPGPRKEPFIIFKRIKL